MVDGHGEQSTTENPLAADDQVQVPWEAEDRTHITYYLRRVRRVLSRMAMLLGFGFLLIVLYHGAISVANLWQETVGWTGSSVNP